MFSRTPVGKDSLLKEMDRDWASLLADYAGGKHGSDPTPATTARPPSAASRGAEALRLDFGHDDSHSQPAPKRSKPGPEDRRHELDLVRAKTDAAKLSSELRQVRREAAEERLAHRNADSAASAARKRLEQRVEALEMELAFVRGEEEKAKAEATTASRTHRAELGRLEGTVERRRRESLESLGRMEESLEKRLEEAESEVLRLRREVGTLRLGKEEAETTVAGLGESNARLSQQLLSVAQAKAAAGTRIQELEEELRGWKEDSDLSGALREDLANLDRFKKETQAAKAAMERHKRMSENTQLLKEQLLSEKAHSERLAKAKAALMDEVNGMKLAMSQASSWRTGQGEVDVASAALTTAANRLSAAENANAELRTRIEQLTEATASAKAGHEQAERDMFQLEKESEELGAKLKASESELAALKALPKVEDLKPLHLSANPLDAAHAERQTEITALEAEHERLTLLVSGLEAGAGGGAEDIVAAEARVSDLEGRLAASEEERGRLKEKMQRTRQVFAEAGTKYRETCLTLTGLEVKMRNEDDAGSATVYEVRSSFEDDPANVFHFRTPADGDQIELMDNSYASRWMDMIEMYLENDRSIPAFLAAVTLQLYRKDDASEESSSAI